MQAGLLRGGKRNLATLEVIKRLKSAFGSAAKTAAKVLALVGGRDPRYARF